MIQRARRHLRMILAGLAVVMLVATSWVVLGDGSPPPDRSSGATAYVPAVESWSLTQWGTPLCDDQHLCVREALTQADQHGDCTWRGKVWLSGGGNPFLLHSLSTEGYAVLQLTKVATHTMSFDFDIGEVWWRSVGEHTDVALSIPCDTKLITLAFNYKGETVGGRVDTSAQAVDIVLHQGPWEYPAGR